MLTDSKKGNIMPSMDFVVDLCEQIKKQKIEFLVITWHKNAKNGDIMVNDFSWIKNKKSAKIAIAAMDEITKNIVNEIEK